MGRYQKIRRSVGVSAAGPRCWPGSGRRGDVTLDLEPEGRDWDVTREPERRVWDVTRDLEDEGRDWGRDTRPGT